MIWELELCELLLLLLLDEFIVLDMVAIRRMRIWFCSMRCCNFCCSSLFLKLLQYGTRHFCSVQCFA